ncbi:hypothetical protein [Paenibacillus silvestris]|nr:hypothetical protein [Paenibacillus silvestris]
MTRIYSDSILRFFKLSFEQVFAPYTTSAAGIINRLLHCPI